MKKRILMMLLAFVMVAALLPTTTFAVETAEAKWVFGTAETAPDEAAYTNSGTLAEAFAAANGNVDATNTVTYVKLNKDVSMTHTSSATALTLNEGKAVVLDLNSKTYSSSTTSTSGGHATYGFNTAANSLLTVKNGTISVSSSNDGYAIGIKSKGNLNVLDCTIEASKSNANSGAHGISYTGGVATITNCTITATSAGDRARGIDIGTTTPALTIADCTVNAIGGDEAYAFYASEYWGKMEFDVAGTITATCANGAFYSMPTTNPVTVTAGSDAENAGESDATIAATYAKKYVKLVPAHIHCICGATHKVVGDHTVEDEKTFTAVSTYAELVTAATSGGSFYLTGDIELTAPLTVSQNLSLCLNGYDLIYNGADSVIIVSNSKTLNITDCGSTGTITGSTGDYGAVQNGTGTFNLYAGTITGNKCGVYNSGTFNMFGGKITGNTGNGVWNIEDFYMNGGEISGNGGDGVYTTGTFTMNGGEISGNDRGVMYDNGTVSVSGAPVINGNTNGNFCDYQTGYYLTVIAPLTDKADIGVTLAEKFGEVAGPSLYDETLPAASNYTECFHSDEGYEVYDEGDWILIGNKITEQPNVENNYTVKTNNDATSKFQWGTVTVEPFTVVEGEDTVGGAAGNRVEITDKWGGIFNANGTWTTEEFVLDIEIPVQKGDVVKFTPVGDVSEVEIAVSVYYGPEFEYDEESGSYTYAITEDVNYINPVASVYIQEEVGPIAEAEDQVTFMVEVVRTVFEPLDNQTAATLDTGDLPTGTYACQVTWDYLNTPADDSDDWVRYSESVEYTESYAITVTANPTAGGTVTGLAADGSYNHGATVTLTATPNEGYHFVSWTENGTEVSTEAEYSFTATEDRALVANFALNTYGVTVTANPTEGGTVTGLAAGGSYNHGATVTLTAEPNAGYSFVNWTKDGVQVSTSAEYTFTAEASCTLVANFERDTYTIKFVNADGTVLQSGKVAYGETPAYTGETPTKAATAQYTYAFKGWDKEIAAVIGDVTYTATYTSTVNEYAIKFVNADGTELQSSEVAYGETPAYTGETPTKAGNAQYTYTFDGWSPAIEAVSGDATYTATYTETVNKYTVTFYDEDGTTVLESKEWEYGQNPVYNNGQNPTKQATAEKTYTFAGWNPGVVMVTSDASYTATFTDATNFYTVTWYDEDGTTVLETASWAYGSVPSSTAATPIKEADAEYTYAFKEWVAMSGLDSDGKVTGDASYKASYTATKIDYTGTVSPEEGTMENVTAGGLGEVAEEINKNIVLTVKVEAADANDTEQTAIKGQAGSRTLEFLDITLKDDGGNSVEVPQSTVLELAIPFTVGNKQNITVYRHHNGTAAAFTALNTKPAADARTDATFYVDSANNYIYVYTNQFSTYAVGYTVPYYPTTYSVVVENAVNGTVKANPSYATSGSTVTVAVTPDKGYVLDKLTVTDIFGREVDVAVKDGKYTFKMPAAKVTVKATFKEEVAFQNPFEDVFATDSYYDAVLWAVKEGITNGTSATTFSPNASCTRAQMVTFLWRAAGSPEPTATTCPFTDVDMDSYYGKAVLWAVENGITKGTSDTTFSPNMECSRAQMATFLCRMAGGKAESDENAFIDVKADAYYADSVQWAVENGITEGTGEGKYSPNAVCTRGQMVTFLYRYYVK